MNEVTINLEYLTEHDKSIARTLVEKTKAAIEKKNIRLELEHFAAEHNDCVINWKNGSQQKHFIWCNHSNNELCVDYVNSSHEDTVYFSSEKTALAAIQALGATRIKKYLFGLDVEDAERGNKDD